MIVNIENITKQLDSKANLYDEVFVLTRDIVDDINEKSKECTLCLENTYPNIKINVEPFNEVIFINCFNLKQDMAVHGLNMKDAIMKIIAEHVEKIYK
ncbi:MULTISPECIES: hypothetical protein [unclassified Clostridium]|uniref:hypothetical protein n=1 Tax=unclassified Clostridium TaxID=2614128 RepID=UPI002079EDFD|nr:MULTISPECIES: hypothetical protein [unclassified Clostridium]